jgi:hypothetical protein
MGLSFASGASSASLASDFEYGAFAVASFLASLVFFLQNLLAFAPVPSSRDRAALADSMAFFASL